MPIERNADSVLVASGVWKSFGGSPAVAGIDFSVGRGESVAIVGPSGSGKSTLLQCIAGIVTPDSGDILFGDTTISSQSDDERSRLRLASFGFVFQFADLVPELSLAENIALPMEFLRVPRATIKARVAELVSALGLDDCAHRRPSFVSGGERQRAAVARAVVNRPTVVFADEPTGALDSKNRQVVLDLLLETVNHHGGSLVLVTHDWDVAAQCQRIFAIADGRPAAAEPETARPTAE